jgi:succinoglycan biosynthesis protein ExoA
MHGRTPLEEPATRMLPHVSIIVPCYNEQATIGQLLHAVLQQSYPRARMEVVIADGISEDGTRAAIAAFQGEHPDLALAVIENRLRSIPSGLNAAIAASRGEIIVRLDAHSIPIPEYVERCVADLDARKGSVVGGVWSVQAGGVGLIPEGIAQAAGHPLGVGDAMYRLRATPGPVDTVPFGAFYRSLFEEIGGFSESLLTNEDYEFNTRVRRTGAVVWIDPAIRSTYIARGSLAALARQYGRYGYWKFKMLQRHPGSLRWRQALPPAFVLSLVILGVSSFFLPLARFLLLLEIVLYLLALGAAGVLAAAIRRQPSLLIGLPLAIATMHLAWGSGFVWSIFVPASNQHG